MRVRIHFHGLVLFWFPGSGEPDEGKLVAELISDPRRNQQQGRPHEHRPSVQEITPARGLRDLTPNGLNDGARVDIRVQGGPAVSSSRSFDQYVPRLSRLVQQGSTDAIRNLRPAGRDPAYVRNTIVVDRGQIRVKDVVIWDAGGFPLAGGNANGDLPSLPPRLKFLGCEVEGHMANECVIDIPDVDQLNIDSSGPKSLKEQYRADDHRPNRPGGNDAVEILITNYEPPRGRPTPWGMDFQWLFAAAGYPAVPLPTTEFNPFMDFARQYNSDLFDEDWQELMRKTLEGRPFPYIPQADPFIRLTPINDIDSRPVCVPASGP